MKNRNLFTALCLAGCLSGAAQPNYDTANMQKEKLGRGLVAVTDGSSTFISWRCLPSDKNTYTYDLYKNGKKLQSLFSKTNYSDTEAPDPSATYQVITVDQTGQAIDSSDVVTPWADIYKRIHLNRPEGGKCSDNSTYEYTPNDCSAGDVDGDGEYEIIVKWDPSNAKDNSQNGYTGPVLIDCYKMDGTQLWRINLGANIRAGAHYTQYLVYDFDGDGRAELICKTAPGSQDGSGAYVTEAATNLTIKNADNSKSYVDGGGRILSGPEYLTIFSGLTGKAIHTINYNPPRDIKPMDKAHWGDNYGNRVDRFLACVAYLDGQKPSAVMCRGYYTYSYLWAVDFDGSKLKHRWIHKSETPWEGAYGEGAHNISTGDVDGDGKDEIMYGSAAIDDDGSLLYRTGMGHGDAIHLGDLDPDRPGLEFFMVHESSPYGGDFRDAKTGEVLKRITTGRDTGRGVAADIDSEHRGYEYWFSTQSNVYNCQHQAIANSCPSMNFRIYWDGDLYDELLDGTVIDKWISSSKSTQRLANFHEYEASSACNGSKNTPCLSADLFGDWREEVILFDGNTKSDLNVFTTTYPSQYKVPALMSDHIYRMGIAWQNVGYNQPPHLGYYLPDSLSRPYELIPMGEGRLEQTVIQNAEMTPAVYRFVNCTVNSASGLPDGVKMTRDANSCILTIAGTPTETGTFPFKIRVTHSFTKERGEINGVLTVKADETALHTLQETKGIEVSPTFDHEIAIRIHKEQPADVHIALFNNEGTAIAQKDTHIHGTYTAALNGLAHLPKGVYLVKVSDQLHKQTFRTVKK